MELFTPDFGLVFWMFVAFIILFLVLAKWGWPAIIKQMEGRADAIDKGVEYAREAKEQLDNAKQSAQQVIDEAQARQADILREAAKMKSQIKKKKKKEASEEARKVMEQAKVSIEQSRKEAELQFRNEVSKFSLDIAEKMVRGQLRNDEEQQKLVSKMLDEIEKN